MRGLVVVAVSDLLMTKGGSDGKIGLIETIA